MPVGWCKVGRRSEAPFREKGALHADPGIHPIATPPNPCLASFSFSERRQGLRESEWILEFGELSRKEHTTSRRHWTTLLYGDWSTHWTRENGFRCDPNLDISLGVFRFALRSARDPPARDCSIPAYPAPPFLLARRSTGGSRAIGLAGNALAGNVLNEPGTPFVPCGQWTE